MTSDTTGVSNASPSVRRVDWMLAVLLASLPLLPSGPRYFGLGNLNYSLMGFVVLSIFWTTVRATTTVSRPHKTTPPGQAIWWSWCAFLTAATGAAFVAVYADHDLFSARFWARLARFPVVIFQPVPMRVHPLYPLSVLAVLFQGALTFAMVRDLCWRSPDPTRRSRVALYGWMTGFYLVAFIAVLQYATRFQLPSYYVEINPALVRVQSTLGNPNALGEYLVLGLGPAIGLAVSHARGRAPSLWSVTGLALGGAALVATVSRSAWGAAALTVLLFMALGQDEWLGLSPRARGRLRRGARTAIGVIVLIVGLSAGARTVVEEEPQRAFRPTTPVEAVVSSLDPRLPLNSVLSYRLVWWDAAIRMFADTPVTGVGLGRFRQLLGDYSPGAARGEAHSLWLQVAAETGVVGLLALGLLAAAMLTWLWKSSQQTDRDRQVVAASCLLGVAALLFTGLTSYPLYRGSCQIALGSLLAVAVVGSAPRRQGPNDSEGPSIGTARFWAPAALVLALVAIASYPLAALTTWQ